MRQRWTPFVDMSYPPAAGARAPDGRCVAYRREASACLLVQLRWAMREPQDVERATVWPHRFFVQYSRRHGGLGQEKQIDMKNKLFRLLCLTLLLTCSPSVLSAQTVTVDGIFYEISGGSAYVAENENASGAVNIRASVTYNGVDYPVTAIGDSAFHGCRGLTEITLPESLTTIGNYAFVGCSGLMEITLPESLTTIGYYAFWVCDGLAEITLPESLTTIGGSAFRNCAGLTEITLPESITSIDYGTFGGCSSLTEITLPESITTIGDDAFSGCSSLTEITLPESITTIGDHAFSGCSSLTEITLPGSLTTIENYAFSGCSSLAEITLPESITTIGGYAFSRCSGLTEITLPGSLTTIGDHAFWACDGLAEITLPESITTIGDYAFWACSGLTEITLPGSLTTIGRGVFSGCSGLTEITLPESLTTIGIQAFIYCSGLRTFIVPENVKAIGYDAFEHCSLLDLVITGTRLGNYTGSDTGKYTFLATVDAGTDVYAPLSVIPDGNDRLIPLEAPRVIKDLESYEYSAKFRLEKNKYYDGPERDVVLSLGDTVIHPDENGGCTVDGLSPATAYTLQVKWGEGDGTSYRRHFTTAQSTGVHSLEIDGPEPEITGYYDLTGRRYDAPQRGFNIVLYSDGTTRKITVR